MLLYNQDNCSTSIWKKVSCEVWTTLFAVCSLVCSEIVKSKQVYGGRAFFAHGKQNLRIRDNTIASNNLSTG